MEKESFGRSMRFAEIFTPKDFISIKVASEKSIHRLIDTIKWFIRY